MSNPKKRRGHSPERVIVKLREADAMGVGGSSVGQAGQHLQVGEATPARWQNPYGGTRK